MIRPEKEEDKEEREVAASDRTAPFEDIAAMDSSSWGHTEVWITDTHFMGYAITKIALFFLFFLMAMSPAFVHTSRLKGETGISKLGFIPL